MDDDSKKNAAMGFAPTRYFSRRKTSKVGEIPRMAVDGEWVGYLSPWAFLSTFMFLCVPLSYIYIVFILLREVCLTFPESVYGRLQHYIPLLARFIAAMQQSSRIVEVWCVIEAVFFLGFKLYIWWLQGRDTLECALSSAPLMEIQDRQRLWERMWNSDSLDLISFVSGWFFDEPIERISRYDMLDMISWSMFEGRHQEHLTTAEHCQLEAFLEEVEHRISLLLDGTSDEVSDVDEKPRDFRSDIVLGDSFEPVGTSEAKSLSSTEHEASRGSPDDFFYGFRKTLPKPQKCK